MKQNKIILSTTNTKKRDVNLIRVYNPILTSLQISMELPLTSVKTFPSNWSHPSTHYLTFLRLPSLPGLKLKKKGMIVILDVSKIGESLKRRKRHIYLVIMDGTFLKHFQYIYKLGHN